MMSTKYDISKSEKFQESFSFEKGVMLFDYAMIRIRSRDPAWNRLYEVSRNLEDGLEHRPNLTNLTKLT